MAAYSNTKRALQTTADGPTPRDSDLTRLGYGLSIRIFKVSPGESNEHPTLRTTALVQRQFTDGHGHFPLSQVKLPLQVAITAVSITA